MAIHRTLLTIAALAVVAMLRAQPLPVSGDGERVVLFTDRSLYIAGEDILFSAHVFPADDTANTLPSRIIYAELVMPSGFPVSQGKFIIENSKASGYLSIPGEILTGIYYVKAYTRFMRNAGPGSYHYTLLKIVNPESPELSAGQPADSLAILSPGQERAREIAPQTRLSVSDSLLHPRDSIVVTYSLPPAAHWCLTVVPEGSIQHNSTRPVKAEPGHDGRYIREHRGISLSGRLVDTVARIPVASAVISLSVVGEKDFMAALTDNEGRFFFSIPDLEGRKDIFLNAHGNMTAAQVLQIDNDFCTLPFRMPDHPFVLEGPEREAAFRMALNVIIGRQFRAEDTLARQPSHSSGVAFYGKPTELLEIDKYIPMPSLEDYLDELPFSLKVRKQGDSKIFRFSSLQAEMNIYEPLLLVDWAEVSDAESVLEVSPQSLDRIEMVGVPYFKGRFIYGGIVCFVSKKHDYGGIDLPSSGIFIGYDMLQLPAPTESPDGGPPGIPDTRNTLAWEPDMLKGHDDTFRTGFTAPDTPGRYVALARGIGPDGHLMEALVRFTVIED
jgi:hypothetical protein